MGPESIELGGELVVGNTTGKLDLKIYQNPAGERLEVEIKRLDLSDLILFARDVSGTAIPAIPHEHALYFEDVALFISSGPPTLKFNCQVDVFGHRPGARASISLQSEIAIAGKIPKFQLGPLEVKGAEGDEAKLDIEITVATQKIYINGHCDIDKAASLEIFVDVELLPQPKFTLRIRADFLSLAMFDLLGTMTGSPLQGTKTEELDFTLHGDFEQKLLDYLNAHGDEAIKSLLHATDADIAAQAASLNNERLGAVKTLDNANATLRIAEAAWDKKQQETHAALDKARRDVDADLARLRGKVEEAHAGFNNEVKRLEAGVSRARRDAAAEADKAEKAIRTAARDGEANLEGLRRALADRQRELQATFGNVDRAIEQARRDVNRAQGKSSCRFRCVHRPNPPQDADIDDTAFSLTSRRGRESERDK